jgi:hypothetical protein
MPVFWRENHQILEIAKWRQFGLSHSAEYHRRFSPRSVFFNADKPDNSQAWIGGPLASICFESGLFFT